MNQQQAFERRIDEALHNAQLRQNFRSAMDGIRQRRAGEKHHRRRRRRAGTCDGRLTQR